MHVRLLKCPWCVCLAPLTSQLFPMSSLIITYHTTCGHNTYDREPCHNSPTFSTSSSSSSSSSSLSFCKGWPSFGSTATHQSCCTRCKQWGVLAQVTDLEMKDARARRLSFQWQQQYPTGLLAIPQLPLRARAATGAGATNQSLREAWVDSRSRAASDSVALAF